jgi:hypothetical protein
MKRIFISIVIVLSFISAISVAPGCANIIPPTGGPKDTLPPVLMTATPRDSTLNFKSNKITLEFDEYVQLDNNLNEQLIVSPNPDNIPIIEAKLRTVTIKLKDSLKPNTTYSIDFGRALKDINENNVLKNFTYIFSTGDNLSDGMITGNVKLAETGEVDSQLLVVLHANLNDSAIKKLKADYYTRLDSSGNFHFNYLPNEKFRVFVLPNDYSKKYDDSTKMFAFYNDTVEASTTPSKIQLYAYQERIPQEKPVTSSGSGNKKSNEPRNLKLTTNLESNEQDLLDSFQLVLSKRVAKFDSSKIVLTDTNYHPISSYRVVQSDTTGKNFALIYQWKENEHYKIIIDTSAFADSLGFKLSKNDTIIFKTKRESQYGSIRLHFNNLDFSRNPVLQLVQKKMIAQSVSLTGKDWYQKLFTPGEYEMRILYDTNKNGVWDPGNFETKRQPEIVEKIKRPLITKANWDNEIDINM